MERGNIYILCIVVHVPLYLLDEFFESVVSRGRINTSVLCQVLHDTEVSPSFITQTWGNIGSLKAG